MIAPSIGGRARYLNYEGLKAGVEMSSAMRYLAKSMNGSVLVILKNGVYVRGILKSYDNHLNLILDNAEEIMEGNAKKLGKRVLIRGDNVIAISTQKIEIGEEE
jgi:small nuclear ribonucleoprotein